MIFIFSNIYLVYLLGEFITFYEIIKWNRNIQEETKIFNTGWQLIKYSDRILNVECDSVINMTENLSSLKFRFNKHFTVSSSIRPKLPKNQYFKPPFKILKFFIPNIFN